LHEDAGGKVAEQAAPGGADCQASAGQQGRKLVVLTPKMSRIARIRTMLSTTPRIDFR